MDIDLYGQAMRVEGGPYALLLYRRYFDADLYQDLQAAFPDDETVPAVSILLQIMWTMAKTADEDFPSYGDWLKSLGEFDLGDARALEVMDTAITAGLFRAEEPATRRERAKRRAARRLGAMALRLERRAHGLQRGRA